MDRTPVSSSNVASIGYDAEAEILEVEFLSGAIYQYMGVPEHHYHGIMSAGSKGTYLNEHIKKGGYSYQRVA